MCHSFTESCVLTAKKFVVIFELFCDLLESDISLYFALLVRLNTSLEVSKLRLLPFSESALCGSGKKKVS